MTHQKMRIKNNLLSILLIGLTIFLINSCNPLNINTDFRIYSADKKQCVTIFTKGKTRYIINGKHSSIPKTNFVKIDISQIDSNKDEIGICWKNKNYEWEIVNHSSKIIENKLDTLKFKFNTNLENNKEGIPNSKKYHKPNCGAVGLMYMNTFSETIIIEILN